VQLGESLDERETDTESTRRAIRCRLGLKEQIEHSGQVFGRDATSVVADFEHRLGALARRAHADVPTRRRVRRGIDEAAAAPYGVVGHRRSCHPLGLARVTRVAWASRAPCSPEATRNGRS
jgi:hypothetical protein